MGQVTSRVSDEVESALNRWSADEGIQRSELIRQILGEAVDARREGRAMFERSDAPTSADLARLVAKLHLQSIELDRVLQQNSKRDAEHLKLGKTDAERMSQARTEFVSAIPAEVKNAVVPFKQDVAKIVELVGNPPSLSAIAARLARIEKFTAEPRAANHSHYNLGLDGWSRKAISIALGVFGLLSIMAFFFLAMILPPGWLALRSANSLLGGGDQAVCALVNYRLATDDCRTQFEGSKMHVRVNATPKTSDATR